jgi:hypothetical protein
MNDRTALQLAADAAVSHGDALDYHARGNADDAAYSARECRERVQACHEAAAREGTPEARTAALEAAGLLMTLPGRAALAQRVQACAADLSAWTSAEPAEVSDLLAEVARASALLGEVAAVLGPVPAKVLHYSVPGYYVESARTPDIRDALGRARGLASSTGTHAAILVHMLDLEDGGEVIHLHAVVPPPGSAS